jgi:amino acid transporter
LFSFVGFESATTLGAEALDPLKTIPRAVLQSSLIGGVFFTICAYTEVLGFHVAGQDLGSSEAPLHVLAIVAHAPMLGLLIDIGALVSLFACTLGCITAAARVLMQMARNGVAHGSLAATHKCNHTPHIAVLVASIGTAMGPAILAAKGATGLDVYGWMGSLATYGFIVAYALVCVGLPRYLRAHGAAGVTSRAVPLLACLAMFLALIGNLYPVPEGIYGKLPYVYLAYLSAGLLWVLLTNKRAPTAVRGTKIEITN